MRESFLARPGPRVKGARPGVDLRLWAWDRAPVGSASIHEADSPYARIYAVVRRVPRGKVATYGQIASLAGLAGHARQVGYALHALPSDTIVPWHRVINTRGEVSRRSLPGWEEAQRQLLEDEGVYFDARGRVDLRRARWKPRRRATRPSA